MAIVTLTYTGSEEKIVSGIPKRVTITSNIPATIYFTLDGTTPTTSSAIYTETLDMPDNVNSVILSAFGVDSYDVSGPILTQTFAADVSRIDIARITGSEGFVVSRADTGDDTPDGFLADGETPARFIDLSDDELDIIRSESGFEGIGEGTKIEVLVPDPSDTATYIDDDFTAYSTPEIAEMFNPTAKVIFIDTRKDNEVNPVLRPHGSLSDPYKEFGGHRIRNPADDATYVSGGFIKRFYDQKNNLMTSFYFDHNENRWIKNVQELPQNIVSTNNLGIQHNASMPLVFEWIYRGRQSSI